MLKNGIFITIEGTDGCGKTTQVSLLKEYFKDSPNVMFTREPGGNYISEQIRQLVLDNKVNGMSNMTEFLLFSASRAQFLKDTINPAIEQGKIVFCERFYDSSIAYQGYGRGLKIDDILTVSKIVVQGKEPDLTIFFDLPVDETVRRRMSADGEIDRIEKEGISFQQKVYDGYKSLAEMFKNRYVTIDASQTIEDTHKSLMKALKERNII